MRKTKWLVLLAVFAVVAALAMLPLGMLGDRFPRRKLLSIYIALWAISQIAIGFSTSTSLPA